MKRKMNIHVDPALAGENFKEYLEQKKYSARTVRLYTAGIKSFSEWMCRYHFSVESIGYADLMAYIKHRQKKGRNKEKIRRELLALRHYFNYLIKTGRKKTNPARGVYIRGVIRRLPHDLTGYSELTRLYEQYPVRDIRSQRNKVILGLLIFQALTIEDLERLQPEHIDLRKGKIRIPAGSRTNERILKLEAVQVIELNEYLEKTRPEILNSITKPVSTGQLIIGMEGSRKLHGIVRYMIGKLNHPVIRQAGRIRMSVITEWTKLHDVRIVQYMCGHRYVSSTERYQSLNLEDLQEQLKKYHPLG